MSESLPETPAPSFAGWTVTEEAPSHLTLAHPDGRTLGVKLLDLADVLDLMEVAGPVSTNQGWMQLAMPAVSVDAIDGRPVMAPASKDKVKVRVRELGDERMGALIWALFQRAPASSGVEAAKN